MKDILLLHGALGSAADLLPLADALRALGFNPEPFEFPGHGSSPETESLTVSALAEAVHAKLQSPVPVFGYSLGGFVALRLAATQPGLISGVITFATKYLWDAAAVQKETAWMNGQHVSEKMPGFAKKLHQVHGGRWNTLLAQTSSMIRDIHEADYLSARALAQIQCPVAVGSGDNDRMVTPEETFLLRSRIPGAALFILPRTKHPLETADPVLLAAHIKQILSAKDQ